MIIGKLTSRALVSSLIFWEVLFEKKPKNVKPLDSIPETEKEDVSEDTPGIVIILCSLFLANFYLKR